MAGLDHPVLQLDQFTLHPEQFTEILAPTFLVLLRCRVDCAFCQLVDIAVFEFELQFLVVAVGQVAPYALDQVLVGCIQSILLCEGFYRRQA